MALHNVQVSNVIDKNSSGGGQKVLSSFHVSPTIIADKSLNNLTSQIYMAELMIRCVSNVLSMYVALSEKR